MQKFVVFLTLSFLSFHADACPQLEGSFRCRTSPPFDLDVRSGRQENTTVYTMTDPNGVRTFATDGQLHEMAFQDGQGQYRARCEDSFLIVEGRSPQGALFTDRYYIERAALVRIRRTSTQASSISCAPTQGTWRRYQN